MLDKNYHLFAPNTIAPTNYHNFDGVVIDVRSQKEFESGAIYSAINIPLFDNFERKLVGYCYKQDSAESAIDLGYKLVEEKIADFKASYINFNNKNIYVYCARGGFRSKSICALLTKFGLKPVQIKGGYKGYRAWCKNYLDSLLIKKPIVLQGLTGVGKTKLLKKLPNSLDLEAMANHRGSLFGGVGLEKVSQKNFESRLIFQLQMLNLNDTLYLEAESSKIGDIFLPIKLINLIKNSPQILITADIDKRVNLIADEYLACSSLGELEQIIAKLNRLIPKKIYIELQRLISDKQLKAAIKLACESYYDIRYKKSNYHNIVVEFEMDSIEKTAQKILDFQQSAIKMQTLPQDQALLHLANY